MLKSGLTINFAEIVKNPCHEWVAPWVERNKNTGTVGQVGPSKAESNLAFNKLAHDYVWGVLDPDESTAVDPDVGNVNIHIATKGGTNYTGWQAKKKPLSAAITFNFAGSELAAGGDGAGELGKTCPLVPFGVFVNLFSALLSPRPVQDRSLYSGFAGENAGAAAPFWSVSNTNGNLSMTLDMTLLQYSIALMDDRLPSGRIAPPRIDVDLLSVSGGVPYTARKKTTDGVFDYTSANATLSDVRGVSGKVKLTLTQSLDASDPDSFCEITWPGHLMGRQYSAQIKDGAREILTLNATQGGAVTGGAAPVWEVLPNPTVPDVELLYSLGPTYGLRQQWAAPIYTWLKVERPESLAPVVDNYSIQLTFRAKTLHWTASDKAASAALSNLAKLPAVKIKRQTAAGASEINGQFYVSPVAGTADATVTLTLPFSALDASYPNATAETSWDGSFPLTTYIATLKTAGDVTLRNVFPRPPDAKDSGPPNWTPVEQNVYADVRLFMADAPHFGMKAELFGAGSFCLRGYYDNRAVYLGPYIHGVFDYVVQKPSFVGAQIIGVGFDSGSFYSYPSRNVNGTRWSSDGVHFINMSITSESFSFSYNPYGPPYGVPKEEFLSNTATYTLTSSFGLSHSQVRNVYRSTINYSGNSYSEYSHRQTGYEIRGSASVKGKDGIYTIVVGLHFIEGNATVVDTEYHGFSLIDGVRVEGFAIQNAYRVEGVGVVVRGSYFDHATYIYTPFTDTKWYLYAGGALTEINGVASGASGYYLGAAL